MKIICKKIFVLFILLILCFTFSSCYDNREIDSLADVIAVGIEKAGENVRYTFAVADTVGFSEGGDSGSRSGTVCYNADCQNACEAIDEVNSVLSKKLNFSHLTIIVASDSYARQNLADEVSFFSKQGNVRPQTLVAISEFSPGEYLQKIAPILEVNTEKYFLGVFENQQTYVPTADIWDFMQSIHNFKTVFVPVLRGDISSEEIGEQDVNVKGATVINGGSVVGIINDYDFLGLIKSEKYINYGEQKIKSVKAPEIYVSGKHSEKTVNVKFIVKGTDNVKGLKNDIYDFLRRMANSDFDVTDVQYALRKNYVDYMDYYNDAKNFKLSLCKFKVSVKTAGKVR